MMGLDTLRNDKSHIVPPLDYFEINKPFGKMVTPVLKRIVKEIVHLQHGTLN